jgi:pimeloyl-ACP methyl ester carboxylesterase
LWEYQIPAFINAGYRFIAINYGRPAGATVGASRSGAPAPYINELMARLGIQKFHLIGTAAGGGLALQYALANREKLRSITVANSIGSLQDKEYSEMGDRIRPPQFNQLPLEFREIGPSYRAANPEGVKRWLSLSGEGRATANPPPPGGPPADRGSNPNAVTWEKLEAFKVPTLLMTGDADLYTPPSVLRMFTARMKHAESAVIPETGHSSYWENPEGFNRTVLAFIGKH